MTDRSRLEERLGALRPTRALVDLDAVAANFAHLRERARGAGVLCVVKADAYGHGAAAVARRLQAEGAKWFGVALVEEGVELREAGIDGEVLLLGGAERGQLPLAIRHRLTPSVVSVESFEDLAAIAAQSSEALRCHVKVDTGMTRLGIPWPDFPALAGRIAAAPGLAVEGLFTHLATSDDPAYPFTRTQLARFRRCRAALLEAGLPRPLVHVASSAGLLTRAEVDVDLVRPGLALYGLNPFGNESAPELTPALTLVTRVVRVAEVPPGTAVGYGCTHVTRGPARLATLPLGYDDGLSRALSGDWEVSVRGAMAPLVGRISMDLVVADVTGIEGAAPGDEVVVVGRGPGDRAHPVEEMARRLKTIPYEVACGLGARVPRVYFERGRAVGIHSRFECLEAFAPGGPRP